MNAMNTEIEKTPAKPTGRKYASVNALLGGEGVSQVVRDKQSEYRGETAVALQLAKLRQSAAITQEEMAKHLGVTQGTISKLESGPDGEITLHEIREYARVTDQRIGVLFGKPLTHTEAIKLHAHGLKERLEALAAIANQNEELQKDIKGFFGEAFFNLFNIIASCNNKLPYGDDEDVEIRIEIIKGNKAPVALAAIKQCKQEEVPA
jgi:transcriptional regulator with XRE-family HTH domain